MIGFLLGTWLGAGAGVVVAGWFATSRATARDLDARWTAGYRAGLVAKLALDPDDDGEYLAENAEAGARGLRA